MSATKLENPTSIPVNEGRSIGLNEKKGTVQCADETKQLATAGQIEANCPNRLLEIAREVGVRIKKVQKHYQEAVDHRDAINALMDEAKELCDEGGLKKFRELFCPQLGKSRAYELLAIASDKKSIEATRARTRERVAKHRANKAATSNSVTVTEKLKQEPLGARYEKLDERDQFVPELATQPRSRIATGDRFLTDFSLRVRELVRTTSSKEVEHFAKTSVTADELAQVGKFLTDIANLKKSRAVRPTSPSLENDVPSSLAPKDVEQPAVEAAVAVGA
jgi:hypothetical protein